ncbi:hypothetical protein P691DRAFT_810242 [Macrolepiota fuliginosa MF-IS2]|uniref:Uncharacterized protein n=1 Tax=Macrolepiota fuliginosa MF-IS2 TaxID=1400762 RepID=A0A9P5X3G3_9AGAR|nr:hypothetical protein P691DRAFT_810242 [Macrolepiota fuliginosa MF-IS2]
MAMFDSSRLKPISGQWSYKGLSQATRRSALQLCPGMSGVLEEAQPMYFLLGYGVNTCLMVAYRSGEP